MPSKHNLNNLKSGRANHFASSGPNLSEEHMTDVPMDVPGRVYITRSALQVIENEARRQNADGQFKHETGGILIGRRLEMEDFGILFIAAATRAGDEAVHAATEFNPDVEYANRQLREYLAIYPRMDYIGIWHQHPPEYPTFSAGDVHSAQKILNDSEYHSREILNPIVWITDGVLTIRFYYMNQLMVANKLPFIQIAHFQIIEDTDPLIAAEKTRPNAQAIAMGPVEEERQLLLKAGYRVQLGSEEEFSYFTIEHHSRPDLVVYAVTPPNYPDSAPLLAVEQFGHKVEFGVDVALQAWAGRARHINLANLVERLISRVPSQHEHSASPLMIAENNLSKSLIIDNQSPTAAGAPQLLPIWIICLVLTIIGVGALVFVIWTKSRINASTPPIPVLGNVTPNISVTVQAVSPTASRSNAVARRWQDVEAANLADKIELLKELLGDGVTTDLQGRSTSQRLFEARTSYADQLLSNGRYEQAADVAREALQTAPAENKQLAADQLANIDLAGGDAALAAHSLNAAQALFAQVSSINPAPAQKFIDQAAQKAQAVATEREQQVAINAGWKAFDQSKDCVDQIAVLSNTIVPLTGWAPEATSYPTQYYDSRISSVAEIWGQTSLSCARSRQFLGQLNIARKLYVDVQQSPDVAQSARQTADQGIRNVDRAIALWAIVNRNSISYEQKRAALLALQALDGFGSNAHNPQGGQTVGAMLVAPEPPN